MIAEGISKNPSGIPEDMYEQKISHGKQNMIAKYYFQRHTKAHPGTQQQQQRRATDLKQYVPPTTTEVHGLELSKQTST